MGQEIQVVKSDSSLTPISRKVKGFNKYDASSLENFQIVLNSAPKEKEVKVNKFANGAKYVPISFIETTLDEMFFGLWQIENFKWQVITNEIVGSIDLLVFHPIAKQWIRRTGAASVMIQVKKETNPMDVNNKITNTLVKDFAHLKSSCLSNAARSLGKMFGRDLNRNDEDKYNPLFTGLVKKELTVEGEINKAETITELEGVFVEFQTVITKNTDLVSAYSHKKEILLKNKKG